jgi:hypothetical protein
MNAIEIPQFTEYSPPPNFQVEQQQSVTFSSNEFWSPFGPSIQIHNSPFSFGYDKSSLTADEGRLYSGNILGAECRNCLQLEIRVERLESELRELKYRLDVKEQTE